MKNRNMTDHSQQRRRFATLIAPLVALSGLTGAVSAAAQPARGEPGHRHGMNPEAMHERMMERRTSHMLDAIEATPAQRSAVVGIAKAAWADIKPMRDQQRTSRQKGRELMFAATIDAPALEQLRVAQLKLHDAMSQRKLRGMVEAMQALTPEQRTKLATRKHGMGHGGRQGGMPSGMHAR